MPKRLTKQAADLAAGHYPNDHELQAAFREGAQLATDGTTELGELADEREEAERRARIATVTLLGAAAATVLAGDSENGTRQRARITRGALRRALNR